MSRRLNLPAPASVAYDALIWVSWLAWVSWWWNRGVFPNDEGLEPTLAYLLLQGWRPWVDYIGASTNVSGIVLFSGLVSVFGFNLWVFRVAFVVLYGGCAWLLFRLLRPLVGPGLAATTVIPTVVFFAGATRAPYLWYNWHGVFHTLLGLAALTKALNASGRRARLGWAAACGAFTITALLCVPPFGIALGGGVVLAVLVGVAGRDRTPALEILGAWAVATAVSLGATLATIAALDLWDGFRVVAQQAMNYNRVRYGHTSPVQMLWAGRHMLDLRPLVLAIPLLFFATVGLVWRLRNSAGRTATWALTYVPYGGLAAVGVALLVAPVPVLRTVAAHNLLLRAMPMTLLLLLPCTGWLLWGLFRAGDRDQRRHVSIWLALGGTGSAFWLAQALTHPKNWMHYSTMTIVLLPVMCAFLGQQLAAHTAGHRARPWLLFWAGLLTLASAGARAGDLYRERPYWEAYAPLKTPGLTRLRASNAAELDHVLSEARRVTEAGGSVFVYPKFYILYPLTGTLPPTRILQHAPHYVHGPPVHVWRAASDALDRDPPDLIMLQTQYTPRTPAADLADISEADLLAYLENWRANPDNYFGPSMPTIIHEILDAAQAGGESPRYTRIYDGPHYLLYRRKTAALSEAGA